MANGTDKDHRHNCDAFVFFLCVEFKQIVYLYIVDAILDQSFEHQFKINIVKCNFYLIY